LPSQHQRLEAYSAKQVLQMRRADTHLKPQASKPNSSRTEPRSPTFGSKASSRAPKSGQLLTFIDKNGVQRDIVLGYDNTSYYRKLGAMHGADKTLSDSIQLSTLGIQCTMRFLDVT
jgi:hypothetical protein